MAKPSEFYIGIVDFFAILLPGAIATALLEPLFGKLVFGNIITAPTDNAMKWAVFLAFSYAIGHLIFLIGSYLDRFYDFFRKRFNPYKKESVYKSATDIKSSYLTNGESSVLNTFQWTRATLLAVSPASAEDVHRLEADSKFFRSLVVVSLLAGIYFLWQGKFAEALIAFVLAVPSFIRYYERRLKSTTQAYIHLITLHKLGFLEKQKE